MLDYGVATGAGGWNLKAEIVSIGTELLLGQIVDTNAAWLAQRLAAEGINLYRRQTIGDNLERAAGAIREALQRSDVVLTTGGLGPTVDDITREAIAIAVGRPIVRDPVLVRHVETLFRRWGREPGENNLRQADLPEGADPLANPMGTAPGIVYETAGGALIFAMPGVPREMKRMFDEQVAPRLRERAPAAIIKVRLLRTAAVGESTIDEQIDDLQRLENPTVGLAAHTGQVDVRITARAATEKEALTLIDHVARQVRDRLGIAIFGEDDETLEAVVARLLAAAGADLLVYETKTGGEVAERLRGMGMGRVVTLTGAPGPLPQAEHALRQARDLAAAHNVTWTLAIFSTEGDAAYGTNPGESLIVVAGPERVASRHYPQAGADEISRAWVTARALDLLRRTLLQEPAE